MTAAMNLTDKDRTRLRKLQDKFLALPSVKKHREEQGEFARPLGLRDTPTYGQIAIIIWPHFERDFQAFVEQGN